MQNVKQKYEWRRVEIQFRAAIRLSERVLSF